MKIALIILALPVIVYVVTGRIMLELSQRDEVKRQLSEAGGPDAQPLNMRPMGYDEKAVGRFWGLLDDKGLRLERRFLELDLIFPFCYGGALAAGLLIGWAGVGRSFSPAWAMLPPVVAVAADWVENLVQLAQLRLYLVDPEAGLQTGWIRLASYSTQIKLAAIALCCLFIIVLAARCALAPLADSA